MEKSVFHDEKDDLDNNVERMPEELEDTHEHYRTRVLMTIPAEPSNDVLVDSNLLPKFAKEIDVSNVPIKQRYVRRRVTVAERQFIWESTNGICYLCKERLPLKSSWHIEHVVAFSSNPKDNDVLGNMLPACQACNLRKNAKDLIVCIANDPTYDLATFAKDVTHLNTAAKNTLLVALDIKHKKKSIRNQKTEEAAAIITDQDIKNALTRIEEHVHEFTAQAEKAIESNHPFNLEAFQCPRITDDMLVDFDEETAGNIGYGAFGQVYVAQIKANTLFHHTSAASSGESTHPCAIKMLRYHDQTTMTAFQREVAALCLLRHPHIVTLYGYYAPTHTLSTTRLGIVMEYCSHSMHDLRAKRCIQPLKIFAQVTEAIRFLHTQQCVHRDIKPNNILIQKTTAQAAWSDAIAKLCDFGVAKFTVFGQDKTHHTKHAGTAGFRPPEVRRGILSFASDIYSLGKTMQEIRDENTFLMQHGEILSHYDDLWQAMTKYQPEQRLTANEVHDRLVQVMNGGEDGDTIQVTTPVKGRRKGCKPVVTVSPEDDAKHVVSLSQDNEDGKEDSKEDSKEHSKDHSKEEDKVEEGKESTVYLVSTAKHSGNRSGSMLHSLIVSKVFMKKERKLPVSGALDTKEEEEFPVAIDTDNANNLSVETMSEEKTKEVKVVQEDTSIMVYVARTSACRENPKGKTSVKYHVSVKCAGTGVAVPIEEAISFRHTPCGKCAKHLIQEKQQEEMQEVIKKLQATNINK